MSVRVAVLGLSLVALEARADLFSPGELARAHQSLSGLGNCTKCHPAGGQLSQESCLECHSELTPRIGKGAGLHGRIPTDKRNCEGCHREHQGEAHQLIDWGPQGEKSFNHQRTGWALKGAHAPAKCTACHEPRLVQSAPVRALMDKRPHTRLGLSTACTACHFDEHRGQQQEDCEFCHVEKAWKPAPGFNHNETKYPLRGKHAKVKCTGCHDAEKDAEAHGFPVPKSETFLRFAPLEYRACTDCHKDPHGGAFGQRCQSCHVPDGWMVLRNVTGERAFHEKTDFPLKGAHLDVDCKTCHGPFPGVKAKFKDLEHKTCATCHPDAHAGQLGSGKDTPDCKACHSEQGFSPVSYPLEAHAKTRYPLEGAHQSVACNACHEQNPALKAKVPKATLVDLKRRGRQELFSFAVFDVTKPLDACETCHADAHKGQFKDVAKGCVACHDTSSFRHLTFDHDKASRFPLEGAHEKVACGKCHAPAGPSLPLRYKPLEQACRACHADEHAGQFSKKEPAACERCHGEKAFKPSKFRHEPPFTDFLLDGQHAQAKCEACHRKVTVASGVTTAQYRPLPRTCEGCHADYHEGAFKGFEP
ncbi:MAG: hypothetical protein JNJ54_24320 [Myxococcaceae bacterium]|nr:hypothetical protein [Myxococcaceae bacterium]